MALDLVVLLGVDYDIVMVRSESKLNLTNGKLKLNVSLFCLKWLGDVEAPIGIRSTSNLPLGAENWLGNILRKPLVGTWSVFGTLVHQLGLRSISQDFGQTVRTLVH